MSASRSALRRPAVGGTLAAAFCALVASPAIAADAADTADQAIVVIGDRPDGANPDANASTPYKVEKSSNGKFTEKVRDTPKTVTIIPKEVIEDMGATSMRDVIRSTPGVTLGTGEGGNAFGDRIFIRGFEARNDVYIDGLRDPGVSSREIFAVEQIEVVKGPSGAFGGRGTTGGLVSLQSKKPQGSSFLIVDGGIGTENYGRGTVDANWAVADGVAVRVNGLYHTADTPGRDHIEAERYGAAASVALQPTDNLSIVGDYYFYRLDGIPDFGHPFDVTTQRPYKVDRDNHYGVIGRDFLKNHADVGTVTVRATPHEDLALRLVGRFGATTNRYIVGTPGSVCRFARSATGACLTTGPAVSEDQYTITAGGQRRWADTRTVGALADATAQLSTGAVNHTLVLGGEFSQERVLSYTLAVPAFVEDASGNVLSTSTFVRNLLNPDPVLGYSIPIAPDPAIAPSRVLVETASAYLIDTIRLSPQWMVTLGGRIDSYGIRLDNPDAQLNTPGLQPLNLRTSGAFFNGQASVLFKPVDGASIYLSYATSSNPSGEQIDGNGVSYDGLAPQTVNLSPERNKAWELGAKWESEDGALLLSGALFRITKSNAREQVSPGVFDTVGELRSQGAELSINGKIGPLSLFGGYTYTDAEIRDSTIVANIGRRFANIPRHSGSLLATVDVSDHLQVGGQVYAQDAFFGGSLAAGTAKAPGYVRFDAVARWKPTDRLELRANVLNLTDKTYYDAIYRSGSPFAYVAPGRSATLTASVTF